MSQETLRGARSRDRTGNQDRFKGPPLTPQTLRSADRPCEIGEAIRQIPIRAGGDADRSIVEEIEPERPKQN
jgi:hypothetical protein